MKFIQITALVLIVTAIAFSVTGTAASFPFKHQPTETKLKDDTLSKEDVIHVKNDKGVEKESTLLEKLGKLKKGMETLEDVQKVGIHTIAKEDSKIEPIELVNGASSIMMFLVNLPYLLVLFLLRSVWWLFDLDGILAILLAIRNKSTASLDKAADFSVELFKSVLDTIWQKYAANVIAVAPEEARLRMRPDPVDTGNIHNPEAILKNPKSANIVVIILSILWVLCFPAIVTGSIFYYAVRRVPFDFGVILSLMGVVKYVLPTSWSSPIYWWIWRLLEAISVSCIGFILARPPDEAETSGAQVEKLARAES